MPVTNPSGSRPLFGPAKRADVWAPSGAGPAPPVVPAFVRRTGAVVQTTSLAAISVPVAAGTDPGDTLIGIVKIGSGHGITSVADSRGNAWAIDVSATSGGPSAFLIRSNPATPLQAGDTITITMTLASSAVEAVVNEYSGVGVGPPDKSATVVGASGTTVTVGPTTPTAADHELVVSAVAIGSGSSAIVAPAGYTERPSGIAGTNYADAADITDQPAGSTPQATWQWSTASVPCAVIATYQAG